jgi:hypothetical protein
MDLPPNFTNFLPLINYYRKILNIDCLTSIHEKFRLYAGYHFYGTKTKVWVTNDQNWYCSDSLTICFKRNLKKYNKNDSLYDELSKVLPNQINAYLLDIYPVKTIKLINNYKNLVIKSPNNEIINLNYKQFKFYRGFYHNIIKPYKNDFKNNNIITISIYFSKNTSQCIEQLINIEDCNAYKKALNLHEYISVYDYLDVSFNL